MAISLFTHSIRVFVADVSDDMKAKRAKLCAVLKKARIDIVYPPDDAQNLESVIKSADCSVHILGGVDIYNTNSDGYMSASAVQYRIAKKIRSKNFKMFIWNLTGATSKLQYIIDIRRDIVENTIFSTQSSPIVFVEELRNIMNKQSMVNHEIENKDIFFIYSDLDKDSASDILNMLEDILTVVRLPITMNSNTDYTEYIKNQLLGCKIGVVYYNFAGDWAVSFARQIWKDNGGQSGTTPIFVVGNSEHAKESDLKIFDGIIETSIRELSLIPLDIKVFYDKSINKTT